MGASGAGIAWTDDVLFLYLGIALGILLLVGLFVILIKMRKIRREFKETLAKRYDPDEILCHDNIANYFGQESFKGKQVRGNGVLVLTKNELYFLRLLPKLELIIPIKRIKKVISPSSFLGKSVLKPLLKVEFKDETGGRNSVAWLVRDLETFKKKLKLQVKKAGARR